MVKKIERYDQTASALRKIFPGALRLVRRTCNEDGMTQQEFGKLLGGIPASTISVHERKGSMPSMGVFIRLCNFMGANLTTVFGPIGSNFPEQLFVLKNDENTPLWSSDHCGVRLRALRVQHGLTQAALADEMGVRAQTVYNYEKRHGDRVPLSSIAVASDIFRVPLSFFLCNEEIFNASFRSKGLLSLNTARRDGDGEEGSFADGNVQSAPDPIAMSFQGGIGD